MLDLRESMHTEEIATEVESAGSQDISQNRLVETDLNLMHLRNFENHFCWVSMS